MSCRKSAREAGRMLRLFGAAMILSGCTGIGLWYSRRFHGRIATLRQLTEIMELLCSEIRYGRETLPECCRRAAERLPLEYAAAFRDIGIRMNENTGEHFADIFAREVGAVLEQLPLASEDKKEFLRFTETGSYADGEMQLRVIEQSREQLQKRGAALERESTDKCRMAVSLGVMSGLLILLLLV